MKSKRKNFGKQDKIQMLLWCDRHCCLCDKSCGIDIEIAHIGKKEDNSFDNGIPVCYECHSKIGMYNELHPRGNKISCEEIKKRREQIYDKYTRQYTVPIEYIISDDVNPFDKSQGKRNYPDITFNIRSLSSNLPIRLRTILRGELNGNKINLNLEAGYYTGNTIWNLNPGRQINGHFKIRNAKLKNLKKSEFLNIRIKIIQIDVLNREHSFLEDGYMLHNGSWYFEP